MGEPDTLSGEYPQETDTSYEKRLLTTFHQRLVELALRSGNQRIRWLDALMSLCAEIFEVEDVILLAAPFGDNLSVKGARSTSDLRLSQLTKTELKSSGQLREVLVTGQPGHWEGREVDDQLGMLGMESLLIVPWWLAGEQVFTILANRRGFPSANCTCHFLSSDEKLCQVLMNLFSELVAGRSSALEETVKSFQVREMARAGMKSYFKCMPLSRRIQPEMVSDFLEQARAIQTWFQPIVSTYNADIIGFEALTRDLRLGVPQSPVQLLEEAALLGREAIVGLDLMCLRTALDSIGKHKEALAGRWLALNICPHTLASSEFRDFIFGRDGPLPAANLVFEITEQPGIEGFQHFRDLMGTLRNMGFRFALDDHGEGESDTYRLCQLYPSFIKIGARYIKELGNGKGREATGHLVNLAARYGAQMIAENVETEENLEGILSLGIAFAQGYFFGKPQPEPLLQVPEPVRKAVLRAQTQRREAPQTLHSSSLYFPP